MSVSVLTAAIPDRPDFLAECIDAVNAQTYSPVEHLILIDHARIGPAAVCNQLLTIARGDWVALIADDDLMHPNHLATLVYASTDADIVYSWCNVTGRHWNPNAHFDPERLRVENYIPATTLIRARFARQIGGWATPAEHGFEDWDFWLRALDAGGRFVCVPEITWTYRFHGGNASYPFVDTTALTGRI